MATKYLYVGTDNILCEIIPDLDPVFPEIPVTERYAPDFLAQCVERTDEQISSEGIKLGMLYDAEADTFKPAPTPEPEPEPEPEPGSGYTITEEEVDAAYKEGINNVE